MKSKTLKIPKQIYYKQASFLQPSALTLQIVLAKAIKKLDVLNRHENYSEIVAVLTDTSSSGPQWLRFINSPRENWGFQFGVMVLYSPNLYRMVIDTALNNLNNELDVSKLPPPAGKQFMETPLYFAVRDNHLVILQSKALRVDAFEAHLNWLLRQSGEFDDNQRLELLDVIPEETRKKLDKSSIKRISLRAPFFDSATVPSIEANNFSTAVKLATGVGLQMLKSILPSNQYTALKVEDMIDVPDIQVNLEIKIVGRKKSEHTDSNVMRSIMHSLRHVEDANFVHAEIAGIGTVKGENMRVHTYKSFASVDGVLDATDVFEVMKQWLESLVDTGTITVDS